MISLKSSREIEIMRRANLIVAEVLQELKRRAVPGVTTLDLDAIAEEMTLKRKAIPAFKGYNVAGRIFPRCLCASVNEEIVHGIPKNRPLHEGDIVGLDFGVICDGYYGDSAITVGVGRVGEEAQRLMDVTEQSLYEGRWWLPYAQQIEIRRRSHVFEFPIRDIIRGRWEFAEYEFGIALPPGFRGAPAYSGLRVPVPDTIRWTASLREAAESADPFDRRQFEELKDRAQELVASRMLEGLPARRFRFFDPR